MKKIIAIALVFVLAFSFAGCQKEESKFYYDYDINEYVTVNDFSFKISRNSKDYQSAYDEFYQLTFGSDLLSETTEGVIEYGDIANINYVGSFDGVPFEGGTASNYDLTIGSGQFIEGFEDGLVGAKIGDTVELDLKFPSSYHNAEYAGKACVFEVKINYAQKYAKPNDTNVKRYGFKSLSDYEKQAEKYAGAVALYFAIYDASEVGKYPEDETKILYENTVDFLEGKAADSKMTLDELITQNGLTAESFKEYVNEESKSLMKHFLVAYYVLQKYESKLTEADVELKREELIEEFGEDLETVNYYEINIEQAAAYDKAIDILKTKVTLVD